MDSPRARLGVRVKERGGDGLLYIFASPFVQHYTCVMRNTRVVRFLYMI